MRFAARIPIVIISWKPMLSVPRYFAGAISDRYTGTDCKIQTKTRAFPSELQFIHNVNKTIYV
ncbi:hypothetical protein IEQ34_016431 [Dendrobium chrysotoxum]|uniref:Uncharacterized protein n=1 Tax=Dendrobium chrysotoxum TaxID=161865 RepID=A0AAV7GFB8_DENCH|nr:hypothetical protein IEQ34_016431 [Dendrobium chrysotoxum]